jgi:hypothetical protein
MTLFPLVRNWSPGNHARFPAAERQKLFDALCGFDTNSDTSELPADDIERILQGWAVVRSRARARDSEAAVAAARADAMKPRYSLDIGRVILKPSFSSF